MAKSQLLLVAGSFWILAGVGAITWAVLLVQGLVFGRGISVGGAGAVSIVIYGLVPLLLAIGGVLIWCGWELVHGHAWARKWLEIFVWVALAVVLLQSGYTFQRLWRLGVPDATPLLMSAVLWRVLPLVLVLLFMRSTPLLTALDKTQVLPPATDAAASAEADVREDED